MSASDWTPEFLDRMRQVGDEEADRAIKAFFQDNPGRERELLNHLRRNSDPIPAGFPRAVVDLLKHDLHKPDDAMVREGERLFRKYAPEVLVVLCCYSLPAAYAARKGVQALFRTRFLMRRPDRRLPETARMVIEVLSEGGLGPDGRGRVTAKKVRLMHAAVRLLILQDTSDPWPGDELGVPLNQEDMAGTLLTFSLLVIEGLTEEGKLALRIPVHQQEAFFHVWQVVGRLLGVDERLIPKDIAEARILKEIMRKRQIRKSIEGAAMACALRSWMEDVTPDVLDGLPSALMRRFLPAEIANDLGIPNLSLERHLAAWWLRLDRILNRFRVFILTWIFRRVFWFALRRVLHPPDESHPPFEIPTALRTRLPRPSEHVGFLRAILRRLSAQFRDLVVPYVLRWLHRIRRRYPLGCKFEDERRESTSMTRV